MNYLIGVGKELESAWQGVASASGSGQLALLVFALLAACTFEFINGFHDTSNAVATVIYTRSLKPWMAVTWSGICNFLGVMLGGTAVAMGIIKLLPAAVIAGTHPGVSMAMVFAVLVAAILWNLGTWYLGLPASSSHTLIGSILGLGLAHAYVSGMPLASGVNWAKGREIGLALLISPILGFTIAGLLLLLVKRLQPNPVLHQPAPADRTPPLPVRALLIATSSGVSFTHGSNDGQKGIGLVMLVLIALMPAQFAIRTTASDTEVKGAMAATQHIASTLVDLSSPKSGDTLELSAAAPAFQPQAVAAERIDTASMQRLAASVSTLQGDLSRASQLDVVQKLELRKKVMTAEAELSKFEKSSVTLAASTKWASMKSDRALLKGMVDYVPTWVVLMIALSIGFGTMIGWKRIVVTLGEKIGKRHMTYAQGASAEIVGMTMIGLAAAAGLPVSTTHVLSSGIAGTMVAGKAGLHGGTVRNIAIAWVLTLPAAMALSAGLYMIFLKIFA